MPAPLGNRNASGRRSAEQCARMQAAQLERFTENRARYGHPFPPEHSKRLSISKIGNTHTLGRPLSPEHRAKMIAARMGHATSPETRARISVAHRTSEKAIASRAKVKGHGINSLSLDLAAILLGAGYELVPEVSFGSYRVDLYEPTRHLAFEADGEYWHRLTESRRPGYYARRDADLLRDHALPTIRLTDKEINYIKRRLVA